MQNSDRVGMVYDKIGGEETIWKLVDVFYDKIKCDDLLSPMFKSFHQRFENGFEEGKRKQKMFLVQRFGGPRTYEHERGHPRLRKRHAPFEIGTAERNRWLQLMLESLDEVGINSTHEVRPILEEYFSTTATHLINKRNSLV